MMSNKRFFLLTYAIAIFARAMTWHEITIIPHTLIFVMYLLFWTFNMLYTNKFKIHPSKYSLLIYLALYYIIWGFINIQDLDFNDTFVNMIRSLMMVLFIIISVFWTQKFKCFSEIIETSYYVLAVLMIISFVANIGRINLLRTLSTFWVPNETLRYRILFGFKTNNIAAEYAMSVILLSMYYLIVRKGELAKAKKRIAIIVDMVMVIIIIANNSRGTLIALLIAALVYFVIKNIRSRSVKRIIPSLAALLIVILGGMIYYFRSSGTTFSNLMSIMNRSHFFDNFEVLNSSGRWFVGIGRISGLYFQEGHYLYGHRLNYMESSYLYYFITSGIIGCVWMGAIIFKLIKNIYNAEKKAVSQTKKWLIIILIYTLVLSLYEGYLFSFSYITSMIFMIIIFSYCYQNSKKRSRNHLPLS